MKPIRDGSKNLPKAIIFPQLPSITAEVVDEDDDEDTTHIGGIIEEYLRQFATVFGLGIR